jgi:O-antigen biosynthesis protein
MIRAAIYNNHLSTWGGGERSTYNMASALVHLGFEVEVVSFEENLPKHSEIEQFFGPGYSGFGLRSLAGGTVPQDQELTAYLADVVLFINHSAGSVFVNPCPLGVYVVMFPFQEKGPFVHSYHHFICISEYARAYTHQRWGEGLSTHVVHPGVDPSPLPSLPRTTEILAIGRFNWSGHRKNQDVLVDAFEEVSELLPKGWRLVLTGKLNRLANNLSPFEELQSRCAHLPVALEIDVSEDRKHELLARASLFWHGTGVGKTELAEAYLMEHFGLAVVEAMQAGVVPLCYYRGGPREIIEHGRSGFLFRDLEELKTFTLALVAREPLRNSMGARAKERATRFTRGEFNRKLEAFVRSVVHT